MTNRLSARLRRLATSLFVILGLTITLTAGSTTAAEAATCRDTSYIPSLSRGTISSVDGRRAFQVQKTFINRNPAVLAWENGRYLGTFYVPAYFYAGTVGAIDKIAIVYETRNGRVVQMQRLHKVLRVCDPSWIIRF